jgi:uncharacterized protein YbcI
MPSKDAAMIIPNSSTAQEIAQASMAYELKRTGHTPKSVTVGIVENTIVITLYGAIPKAEKAELTAKGVLVRLQQGSAERSELGFNS